jgi:hypothetical protein
MTPREYDLRGVPVAVGQRVYFVCMTPTGLTLLDPGTVIAVDDDYGVITVRNDRTNQEHNAAQVVVFPDTEGETWLRGALAVLVHEEDAR